MNYFQFITFFIFLAFTTTSAQVKVSGKITDGKTKKPVPYVDVTLPIAGVYTTTNTDGTFYLESSVNDSILEITANGYEFLEFKLLSKVNYNLQISLTPLLMEDNPLELSEATLISTKNTKIKRKIRPMQFYGKFGPERKIT